MIVEIVLAIEVGADAVDIGKTIHPMLSESLGMAPYLMPGLQSRP
jgi:dihydrolipoamide dehydrogenase